MVEDYKKYLEEAYTEHADTIYRLCYFKTGSIEQAEDLVQTVFIKYWDYTASGKKVDKTKSFLFQIARNLIIDFYCKKKSISLDYLEEEGFMPSGNEHSEIYATSEKNEVLKCVKKLQDKYQEVVYLRIVEEYSMKEIAKLLNISAANVAVRCHRGIRELRKIYHHE
ncbi:MAG: RNA polymerase sigma factor [Candidatus Paceibacterota bacterium]